MSERTPLRALNETSGIVGLTMWDICGVGYIFVLSHSFLESHSLGLLAFLIAALAFAGLAAIRSNFRPKIIRDSLKHVLLQKVIYDPYDRQD